jgi:hypothetical protein
MGRVEASPHRGNAQAPLPLHPDAAQGLSAFPAVLNAKPRLRHSPMGEPGWTRGTARMSIS